MKEPLRLRRGTGPARELMRGADLPVPRRARERALQFVSAAVGMSASGTALAGTSALVKSVLVSVSLGALGGGFASLTASRTFSYLERRPQSTSQAAPERAHRKVNAGAAAAQSMVPLGTLAPASGAMPELAVAERAEPAAVPLAVKEPVAPVPSASARPSRSRVSAPGPALAASAAEAPEPVRPSLFEEQRAIDSARAAIGVRDFRAALATLDEYERRYQKRQFGPEALALRVQALVGSNRVEAARTLAGEFERRYPHHPLLPRVQMAVAR